MKYYFLGLATVVAVCVGCASDGGTQLSQHSTVRSTAGKVPITLVNDQQPGMYNPHAMSGSPGMSPNPVVHQNFHSEHRNKKYVAPPAHMLLHPGPMVDGPGPGVLTSYAQPSADIGYASRTSQLRFVGPVGMEIGWQIRGGFAEKQITAPNVYNFRQGAIYRLKLANIPERPGLMLYPTLQVYPSHPQTDAYLSHNSIPLQVTDEDLEQVQSNNFVTKVIFLPSPRNQELAVAGVETLVSTRLDPGVDPVAEADRRGTIMAVLRIGNMNLETAPTQGPMPGGVTPAGYVADGDKGEHVAPEPIEVNTGRGPGIPPAMVMGTFQGPGRPAYNPIAGRGGVPSYGMPYTSSPIGMDGPPTLPMGGPASLRSYTIRNRTKMNIPKPTEHVLVDIERKPGYSLPKTASHIKITERHPLPDVPEARPPRYDYSIRERLRAERNDGEGMIPGDGTPEYCPPGQ